MSTRCAAEAVSERRDDVEFDVVVVDGGAGAEFEAVADLVAEGVEGVGGAEARGGALRVVATGLEAVAAGFHCYIESHAERTLRLDIDAVNYADNDGTERGILVLHDLAGGIAFVDDQHALADTHAHAAVDGDEIAAGFAAEILFLDDEQFFARVERMIDRRDDVAPDSAEDHDS